MAVDVTVVDTANKDIVSEAPDRPNPHKSA